MSKVYVITEESYWDEQEHIFHIVKTEERAKEICAEAKRLNDEAWDRVQTKNMFDYSSRTLAWHEEMVRTNGKSMTPAPYQPRNDITKYEYKYSEYELED